MIVLILFFISFNFVSAGNNTTIINEVPIDYPNHDVVIAEEDGHFNINFSGLPASGVNIDYFRKAHSFYELQKN